MQRREERGGEVSKEEEERGGEERGLEGRGEEGIGERNGNGNKRRIESWRER